MAVVAGFHCDAISCELARRCVRRGAAEASRSSEAQRVCMVVVTRSFSLWSYSIAGSNSDPDRGAEYCDEHVCVSVSLSAIISPELRVQSSPNFSCMLPMAVARSSSGGVVIRYELPVCG